jgi:two-component system, LytTR family, sensor kinase
MKVTILDARRSWLLAAALVAAATVLGLIEASHVQYDRARLGVPITWPHALLHGLPRWYAWAVLAPVVFVVARRVHVMRRGPVARLGVHAVTGIAVVLVQIGLFSLASSVLHDTAQPFLHLRPAFAKYIGLFYFGGLVTYALLVAGWHAVDVLERYRRREREAARLELQTAELKALLAEAQLRHLQAQLQPHFLFNTLHALGSLVFKGENTAAVRMTTRLSELLRRSLRLSEQSEIKLDEELRLADDYLSIQQLRFGDRLRYVLDASDDARAALVPVMLLQPLVENAVLHGVENDTAAGLILVDAIRAGDELLIRVYDDGPGVTAATGASTGGGLGLYNTRARLHSLYGDNASLSLTDALDGGAEVRVRLPYRTATTVMTAMRAGATP